MDPSRFICNKSYDNKSDENLEIIPNGIIKEKFSLWKLILDGIIAWVYLSLAAVWLQLLY